MNPEQPFNLKHTNVSIPQLGHSHSKQSITASEDYYSFSDEYEYAESAGSDIDRVNPSANPFVTPPSRRNSPLTEQLQSEGTVRHVRSRQRIGIAQTGGGALPLKGKQIQRKAVNSATKEKFSGVEQKSLASGKRRSGEEKETKRVSVMNPLSPSTTPGIDETPYIRFAIDQLTRDEEVRGSRHYATAGEENTDDDDDDDDANDGIEDYPVDRIVSDEGLGYISKQKEKEKERDMARQKEMQAGSKPKHPLQNQNTRASSSSIIQYDVFVPYNPPVPTNSQPRLNFLPGILRPLWLGIFTFLCIAMLTLLILSAAWSLSHDGLWEYVSFGDSRYFVFEYLPTILGIIILTWLFQIQIAVQRIAPFMAMASYSTKSRSESSFLDLYPTQFLLPNLQHFRAGQPVIGLCFIVFWFFLFTIPLLASSYNVRFYGPLGSGVWRWVVVQGVIWTVILLYIILILALIALAVTLWRSQTGLKWDPRSLADIVALLERANIMNDYADTEIFSNMDEFKQRLWNRTDRLGYWHTSRRPQDIFYGLGEEGGATRRYSLEQGRIREKAPLDPRHSQNSSISSLADLEAGAAPRAAGDFSIRPDIRNNAVRRKYMPWFLSSSAILAWILITVVLLIAFYVVAFVNHASTRGFLPQLGAAANQAGFSPANFLYSFIPCTLGFLMYLLWLPLDFAHRRLAPFAAMNSPRGATAEKSLLLDYPFAQPVSVTVSALSNGHWKVALLSVMSTINMAIPILSGGIFWAQWYPGTQTVRIAAHPAGLYALCFFLAIYTVAIFALVPGRKTVALPHGATCLAEVISWLYMSPLLCDRSFARCNTKPELVGRLIGIQHDESAIKKKPSFWASVTNLVGGASHDASRTAIPVDDGEDFGEGPSLQDKRLSTVPEDHPITHRGGAVPFGEDPRDHSATEKLSKNAGSREEVRYGFGVFVGRDGKEHLGVERVRRGGHEMVLFEDGNVKRKSWMGF
ncbi:hypothetical protein EJ08DRAFT_281642 [Tothia fuscella]|uniref:Phosphoribosylaminoimidazole-succinocarboxamide synthase n=1 Tax=Tothia fuscella TaxID=1048955 RepID=A0A9P4P2J1_9PEZI|nr:hypothetical protein EJ08DRAFT_281642 [Tothia fuscella]